MTEERKKRRLTRRKSVAGGRGLAPPRKETEAKVHGEVAVPPGSKKRPAAFCRNTTQLMGIIIKQCLRTEQDTRSLCGAIFDTVTTSTEHDVVKSMRAQTRLHTGPTSEMGMGRIVRGSPEAGNSGRSGNSATLTSYLKQLDGMSMDTKCDQASFCRVDRTPEHRRPSCLENSNSGWTPNSTSRK